VRQIALDVHRDFCEVAIGERGAVWLAGRIATTPAELELFGQSLAGDDELVLEATGNALAIARILEPFVARVVLADPKAVRAAARGRAQDRSGRRAPAGTAVGCRVRRRGLGRG
jgi:hypothetical protein